ncbi:hypothetical protein NE236_34000 [Actinoallomurus purpureus]|uniref:hypothetical protein n=1 Tax=Actinoallomurus purpureus TaxID=478114 RepID=UPI002093A598|nr:hypothetical protein [Actinoallomurus purpureus]MCO6009996.1 hypothetical protein [Actinoallomurus purpureus]
MRSVVGNDHQGTLYPAAVAATERLLGIVVEKEGPPRLAAVWVLLDWWGTFQPEPAFEVFVAPDGATVELIPQLIDKVLAKKDALESIAASDPHSRKVICFLLRCADSGWVVPDLGEVLG